MIIETVRDLIEALQQVDPNYKVRISVQHKLADGDVDTTECVITGLIRYQFNHIKLELHEYIMKPKRQRIDDYIGSVAWVVLAVSVVFALLFHFLGGAR